MTGFTVREGICSKNSPDFELRRIPIFKYDSGIRALWPDAAGFSKH